MLSISSKKSFLSSLVLCLLILATFLTPFQNIALAQEVIQPLGLGENITIDYGSCNKTEIFCWIVVGFKYATILVLNLIAKLGSVFLIIGSFLVYEMAKYGTTIISLPVVTSGFKVSLSLTNLFFVIAIIIMAFGTMLRNKTYNIKSQIKRLVLAAILVNFSFLIAGLFIDLSNVLTASFLQNVHPDKIGLALQPQSLLTVKSAEEFNIISRRLNSTQATSGIDPASDFKNGKILFNVNEDDKGWAVWLKLVQAAFLAVVLTWLMAGVMLALGIMILIRNIWLAVLLIFMPLIWGIGLIPRLEQYSKKWWEHFIRWIIYLPTVTFFVFLAISTMIVTNRSGGLLGAGFFDNLVQILILVGLLWAAIKIGKASGVMGAGLAFGVGAFIGSRVPRALGKVGLGSVARASLAAGELVTTGALTGVGKSIGWTGGKLGLKNMKAVGGGLEATGKFLGKYGTSVPRKIVESSMDSKNRLADLPKRAEAGLSFAEDVAAGKKSVDFSDMREAAAKKIYSEEFKDKNREEALEMVKDMGKMSGAKKAALGMLLAKHKALGEVGAVDPDKAIANKKALLDASISRSSSQMAETMRRGLSENDPEFAVIAKATLDAIKKAKTPDEKKAKKGAKEALKRIKAGITENLGTYEEGVLTKILEGFDAKKMADIPLDKIANDKIRKAVVEHAMEISGATSTIMNAKTSVQKAWIKALDESFAPNEKAWQSEAPSVALNRVQAEINAARAAGNDTKELISKRNRMSAWHKLSSTPGDPTGGSSVGPTMTFTT